MVGHLCRALGDEVSPPQQQENIGNWIASCMPSTCYQGDQSGVDSWLETNIKKTRLGIPTQIAHCSQIYVMGFMGSLNHPSYQWPFCHHLCSSLRRVVRWPSKVGELSTKETFNQPILGLPNCPKFIFDSSTTTSGVSESLWPKKCRLKSGGFCRFVEDFPLFLGGGNSRVEKKHQNGFKDLRFAGMYQDIFVSFFWFFSSHNVIVETMLLAEHDEL